MIHVILQFSYVCSLFRTHATLTVVQDVLNAYIPTKVLLSISFGMDIYIFTLVALMDCDSFAIALSSLLRSSSLICFTLQDHTAALRTNV